VLLISWTFDIIHISEFTTSAHCFLFSLSKVRMFQSRLCLLTLVKCGRTAAGTVVPGRFMLLHEQLRFLRSSQPSIRRVRRSRNIDNDLSSVNATVERGEDYISSSPDNEYFKRIVSTVEKLDIRPYGQPFSNNDTFEDNAVIKSSELVSRKHASNVGVSESLGESDYDLSSCTPALPVKSFNLAAYVNESVTLSNLVKLGVDLSKLEGNSMVADRVVKMDFEDDVKPVLLFLHRIGIADKEVGNCISKHPDILCESLDDMQVRINYLESKKFSQDSIARIVSRQPEILTLPTKGLDAQLGYLQKDFMLSGRPSC
jgi:mTERF